MTKFLLHSSLIFTYVIYMLSQMELLKNYRDIVQYAIIFLMIISLFLIVKSYPTKIRQIFYQKRTIILLISIFLFNLVFSEPTSLLVVISKVLFLVSCLTLLTSKNGAKNYISIADAIVLFVLIVATLAQLGVIPSASNEVDNWTKNSVGFNNPNTPFFFLFSSFLIYFIYDSKARGVVCLIVMAALFLIGSFSRTYFCGTILICLIALLANFDLARYMTRTLLFFITLLSWVFGSSFYAMTIFKPEILAPFAFSPLDYFLSFRISLALENVYIPANNLAGITFTAKDSIYHELLFVFGPFFWAMFFFGICQWWIASKNDKYAFKIFSIISVITITGLFETIFLNLTPISSILLSIAFMRPNKALDIFKNKTFIHNV